MFAIEEPPIAKGTFSARNFLKLERGVLYFSRDSKGTFSIFQKNTQFF